METLTKILCKEAGVMSMENFRVIRFFYYFQDENGKKTQNITTARGWIEKGKDVRAILSDGTEEEKFKTDPIKQISVSELDYKMVILTVKYERIFVKMKFPKSKYVHVSYFFRDSDLPENRLPKVEEAKKGKTAFNVMEDVKKLVDKAKDVHAVYQDECKVITSKIVKVDVETTSFVNDVGITYFMT